MPTRKYEQGLRAEAAEETRRRILDALYARLSEQPSEPVSVDQIARLARVARSTIYLSSARAPASSTRSRRSSSAPASSRSVEAAAADPDAREYLRGATRGATEMFAAHRDVFRVLYSMAQLDPNAVGGAVQRLEEARARGHGAHRASGSATGPAARRRHGRRCDQPDLAARRASTPSTCSTRAAASPSTRSSSCSSTTAERALYALRARAAQPRRDDAQRREAAALSALGAAGVAEPDVDRISPDWLR